MEFQYARRGDVQPLDDVPAATARRPVARLDPRHDGDAVALHPGVNVGRGRRRPAVAATSVALDARRGGGGGGATGRRAARVRRRRGHRALAAQVTVGPRAAAQATQPPEPVPELGRH